MTELRDSINQELNSIHSANLALLQKIHVSWWYKYAIESGAGFFVALCEGAGIESGFDREYFNVNASEYISHAMACDMARDIGLPSEDPAVVARLDENTARIRKLMNNHQYESPVIREFFQTLTTSFARRDDHELALSVAAILTDPKHEYNLTRLCDFDVISEIQYFLDKDPRILPSLELI